ncbi:hypothetical protein [Azospirillum picis]|uniref:hypothetical protein n=1 Tax=Azospirillum picis TaxID=488438 RepID=UPI0027D90750|nr:hypothetical protein [Azospirillum picis]
MADQPTVSVLHDRLTITQNDDSGADANWLALDITPHLKDSDGSEVASLTITGVPTDAKLNHGSRNDNGSWTVPDGQWGDLKLLPGAHNAHDFTLTIVANATESGSQVAAGQGTAVSDPVRIAVTVTGIAETPLLVPGAARGNEDTLIDLKLSLSVSDPNERLTKLELTGVPSDSHFFAGSNGHPIGHDNGDGRWSFSAEEVATIRSGGLYLQPPKDWSDYDTAGHDTGMRIGATLTAEATDPDSKVVSTSHTEQTLSVRVDAVADQPKAMVAQDASGHEYDGKTPNWIALSITAPELRDQDGSETLAVTVTGLPAAALLNHGSRNDDGSWTVAAGDLGDLKVQPGAHDARDFTLTFTATATEQGSHVAVATASTSTTLKVTVEGVADTPMLRQTLPAGGDEDTRINLNLTEALGFSASSATTPETLTLTITGVPAGTKFFSAATGDTPVGTETSPGTWTFNDGEIAVVRNGSLYMLPPTDWSDYDTAGHATGMQLQAKLTASETDPDSGIVTHAPSSALDFTVTVNSVADAPSLTFAATAANGTTTVKGAEFDGKTENWIALKTFAAPTDKDGSEYVSSVTITGLPAGARLNAGIQNNDGSWTIAGDPDNPAVLREALANLKVLPGAHDARDFTLTFVATATELGSHVSKSTATTTQAVRVEVEGVADTPVLHQTLPAGGDEDTRINLNLTEALGFTLSSTTTAETLTLTITGVPDKSQFFDAEGNSIGTQSAGTWTFSDAEIAKLNQAGNGLYLKPPPDWSDWSSADHTAGLPLHVTLTATEVDPDSGKATTASTATDITVHVDAVADTPKLGVSNATGSQNDLSGAAGRWIDLKITPTVADADGSEYIASITISKVPAGATLNHGVDLGITDKATGTHSWKIDSADIAGLKLLPPAHDAKDFSITVQATASERGEDAQVSVRDALSEVKTILVTVKATAEAPILGQTGPAKGDEDTRINVHLDTRLSDPGETFTGMTISGQPEGTVFYTTDDPSSPDYGTMVGSYDAASKSWSFSAADLTKIASAGHGLFVQPPRDWSDWNSGNHSAGLALTTKLSAQKVDPDSKAVVTATTTRILAVEVDAVADAPTVTAAAAAGKEGAPIKLSIAPHLTDADGSEVIDHLTITGIPDGATLTDGNGRILTVVDGAATLTPEQLKNLHITPPAHSDADFTLHITATAKETGDPAHIATSSATSKVYDLRVTVEAVADTPKVTVTAASGNEDSWIDLGGKIAITTPDHDGSESLSLRIEGLPTGALLNHGSRNADGSWTLYQADLADLKLLPPKDVNADLTLKVTGVATEASNGDVAVSTPVTLTVTVTGTPEAPLLSQSAHASGYEDSRIDLHLTEALTDRNEALSLTLGGIPPDAQFYVSPTDATPVGQWVANSGEAFGGHYSFTAAEVDKMKAGGLFLLPPKDWSDWSSKGAAGQDWSGWSPGQGGMAVTATLISTDTDVDTGVQTSAGTKITFDVHVKGVADAPNGLGAGNFQVHVKEDGDAASGNVTHGSLVDLGFGALSPKDGDGSEHLSVVISDLPAGCSLQFANGVSIDNLVPIAPGKWSVDQQYLSSLRLVVPENANVDTRGVLTLRADVVVTEVDGDVRIDQRSVEVTIDAVTDQARISGGGTYDEDAVMALHLSVAAGGIGETVDSISLDLGKLPSGSTFLYDGREVAIPAGGLYTVPAGFDLSKFAVKPPQNYSDYTNHGNPISIGVSVVSHDHGAASLTTTKTLTLAVSGVADAPTVSGSFSDLTMNSGLFAALPVADRLNLGDKDSSERLWMAVDGLPDGAILVDGAGHLVGLNEGHGRWLLTPAQWDTATGGGGLNLRVPVGLRDSSGTALTSATITITPLSVERDTGSVGQGSPTHFSISFAENGASHGGGSHANNGWGNGDQTAPGNSGPNNNAENSTGSTGNGNGNQNNGNHGHAGGAGTGELVPIDPTMPSLGYGQLQPNGVIGAKGAEDGTIALSIKIGGHSGQTATLVIDAASLPAGAKLSAGIYDPVHNVWTVGESEIADLSITPPANWNSEQNGSITLLGHVVLTDPATGGTSIAALPMTVLVDAVTDSPTLSGGGQGKEDHPIALNLAVAAGAAGETVESVVISDVPPGAKLIDANGAVLAADPVTGHYTMSVATAAGLKLLPPANWSDYSGSLTLHVEVTARDHLAAPVTIDKTITVGVAGVTDPVTLDTSKASGREDQWITLNDATIRHLTASLDDTDGSQAMSVVITGVPAGAVFNHGANNGLDASGTTYSWKFSAADVGDLKFLAPQDYNGTLTLSVTAYTWERGKGDPVDGGMVATTAPLTIAVAAAADAPQIFVHMARGTEDSPIALDISGMVPSRGNDMIDAWTITLPSSAYTLSAGTLAADGVTWTLTPAQLANLTVSAPHDSAASFTVTVAARSSELDPVSGQRVYSPVVTTSFAVNIDAVADKPTVSAAAASGMEDGWIELKITPAVTDADGSESIGYITIDKVPDGALLNHGVDLGITDPASNTHSWRVSAADIAGLKLLPPPDDAHDMMLSVRATSIERSNGNTATSDAVGLAVTVTAAADTPHLTQSAPAHGDEDSRIALNLSPMLGAANETLSMTLTGIPDGAVLYLSSDPDDPRTVGTFDAVSHTWRLLGSDLAKIQANGLYLKPPPNWSDWSSAGHTTGMTVVATLTSTDHDPDAPQTAPQASTSLSFTVHVDSVADAPKLTASPVTTPEDQPIALNIRASLGDTTGSEYLVGYTITGVPTGASLNHGTRNGDGSWSLKPGDVDGLKITPPLNSDADFTLHIEAVSHNWQNDGTATATADLRVTVNGVADTPALTQGTAAAGNEDTRIALNLDMAVKGSNETLGLVLTGVPEGSTFYSSASGGAIGHYDAMTKSWSFDSGEIATLKQTGNGLYIKPPEDWSDWNTANHNAGASITATLTASQTDPDSHVTTTADKTLTFTLHINAVADQPTVSVLHDRLTITQNDDSGADANWLALDITPHLKDSDGSEVASLTITGVPTDAKLNHGSRNDNGSWTMPDGQWGDLKLLPGAHNAHDFTLTIVANATESGSQVAAGQGTAVSDPVRIAVTVTGIAETPLLVPGAARGNEDTLIDLKLSLSVSDPNERLTKLELTGVPSDSHFFAGSNGHPIGHDDGNGRWSFSAEEVATIRSGGLYLQPPKNWSDYDTAGHDTGMRIGATLTAEATDPDSKVVSTSHTEQTLSLHVDGVADQPDLTLAPVHGTVGTAIALNIGAVLKDTDGSETLTVTIAPLPSGYSLNNGHHNTDGSWTLGAQDLPGLALTAPAGAAGSVALSVTAQATDGHSTAETTGSLTVTLDPANQAPVLSADHSATISAADPKVAEHASVTDPDSSELSRLTISIVSGAESGDRLTLGSLSLVEDPATHRTTVAGTDVEVSWDAAANQLTLHGTASTATYTDILQHVSMTTADGSGMRTLEVKATDAAGGASNPMRVDVQVVGDQITNAPASSARTFAVSSADPTETGDGLAASDHAMAAAMANTGADAGTAEAGAVSSGSSDDAASGAAALDRHYTESMALLGLSDHPSMSGAGDWTGAGSLGGGGVSTMDDSWIGQSSHPADPATTGDPLAADGTTHHDPAILTPVTPEVERVPA